MLFRNTPIAFASTIFALLSFNVQSTVVEIRTALGTIEVNLFDNETPKTVNNFLNYVDGGKYANNVVHRSVDGFVVQAGGYTFNGGFPIVRVVNDPAIENEPELSNVRGTIAMAKGSNPNSATSQWFINTGSNANSLDVAANAGGFTVFGQVLGDGMDVVDQINSLKIISYEGLNDFPIRNEVAGQPIIGENLVLISDVVVTDRAVFTNTNLNPARNTLINTPVTQGSDGGGTFTWLGLFMLLALCFKRSFKLS
ncbi:peptidylprolyl isomerase [Paraglaciecola psychrophila]|uniref:Peptidyl-prolyl cis-trans isomerase n=1 Tax=Paraglaciecola psychrophila 170 TaxID=1129794 RepID=K7A5V6_9ALTE|nr:peptidylprolyl isomerase [Paraglaciecola psychrophila]AGH47285.1 cyclophilin type peptidyl-prolyl cis-trans isomerase [Paraglaciecola psychrophila 170]GAC37727.1 peptidyl-prolyl cis-trans isomerase A [Paraglaciecola psychrophila 170]